MNKSTMGMPMGVKRSWTFVVALKGARIWLALMAGVSCCGVLPYTWLFGSNLEDGVQLKLEREGGPPLIGRLVGLEADKIEVEDENGARLTLPLSQLVRIAVSEASSTPPPGTMAVHQQMPPACQVLLTAGTILYCGQISLPRGSNQLLCHLWASSHAGQAVPLESVESILFQELGLALSNQWQQLRRLPLETDRLVVAREKSLDFYPGTVEGIERGVVVFRLEDQTLEVPLSRLVGVVFGKTAASTYPGRGFCVELRGGSRLWARTLSGTADHLRVETLEGANFQLSWREVTVVDLIGRRMIPLVRLPVLRSEFRPAVPLPGLEEDLAQLLLPSLGQDVDQPADGRNEPLLFPVGSRVDWKLPEEAAQLQMLVQAVAKRPTKATLRLRIAVDDRPVVEKDLAPGEQGDFQVSVSGGQALSLVVDTERALGIGLFLAVQKGNVVLNPKTSSQQD